MRTYKLAISRAVEARQNSLGEMADDVALALWIRGRKGYRGHAGNCPVAEELQTIPGADDVSITVAREYAEITTWDGFQSDQVSVPDAVQAFITRFDNLEDVESEYPELVAGVIEA